jgi:predicted transcriptional regulator
MLSQESDAIVLAKLRERGPGPLTVKQIAQDTGLTRVTVRTAVSVLADEGLICVLTDCGESTLMICHLHAAPGECDEPMGLAIQEVHPDGQR